VGGDERLEPIFAFLNVCFFYSLSLDLPTYFLVMNFDDDNATILTVAVACSRLIMMTMVPGIGVAECVTGYHTQCTHYTASR
jgi:hypothetical protein